MSTKYAKICKIPKIRSILKVQCHTFEKMKADGRLIFRLAEAKKTAFTNKVERQGKKVAEVLNELVDKYLEELEKPSEIEEVKLRLTKVEEQLWGESAA